MSKETKKEKKEEKDIALKKEKTKKITSKKETKSKKEKTKKITSKKENKTKKEPKSKKTFLGDVKSEMKKVRWPLKKEMLTYSAATILIVLILALFFVACDLIISGIRMLFI